MKFTLFNARSIHNKWAEIVLYVNLMSFDAIGICESWITDNDDVITYNISGYTSYTASRIGR
jgi:hypothetical protein